LPTSPAARSAYATPMTAIAMPEAPREPEVIWTVMAATAAKKMPMAACVPP
jgi:hypothetical protein